MAMMSAMIMEGVNAGSADTDLYGSYDFSASAIAESSYMTSACATLFSNIMEAEQGFMVSDVVGAATVIREQRAGNEIDQVAVYEGIIQSGIEKLKSAFQKFIAKVKEYYKKVIDWFKAMFANAETFAKQYGDMLKKKAQKVKDFHYTGFKYTITNGDKKADAFGEAVKSKMNDLIGKDYDIAKTAKTKQEFHEMLRSSGTLAADFKEDDKPTSTEEIEKFISSKSSSSDISDLRTELIEEYQDGDSSKSDIKDFEANSVDEMVKFLKDSNNKTTKWESQLKTYEEKVGKVIQKLNSFMAKDGEAGGDNLVSNASYISSLMSAYLNLYKVPCEVKIGMYKAISRDWLGVLKKFYNFKGNAVKESVEYDPESIAMLESSLVLEGEDCGDGGDGDGGKSSKPDKGDDGGEAATESAVSGILEIADRYAF